MCRRRRFFRRRSRRLRLGRGLQSCTLFVRVVGWVVVVVVMGVVLVARVCCLQSRFPRSPISSHLEPSRVAREIIVVSVCL